MLIVAVEAGCPGQVTLMYLPHLMVVDPVSKILPCVALPLQVIDALR